MRHTLAAGSVPFVSLNSACLADAACLVTQPRAEMAAPVQVGREVLLLPWPSLADS